MRARSLSAEYAQLQPEIVAAFGRGDSMACLARRHGVTVQTVERLIRRAVVTPLPTKPARRMWRLGDWPSRYRVTEA